MAEENVVCIVDFCGRWNREYPVQFWADWHRGSGLVKFGGRWHGVPGMPSDTEPTDDDVTTWAARHGATVGIPFAMLATT